MKFTICSTLEYINYSTSIFMWYNQNCSQGKTYKIMYLNIINSNIITAVYKFIENKFIFKSTKLKKRKKKHGER